MILSSPDFSEIGQLGYQYEPEYTEEEITQMEIERHAERPEIENFIGSREVTGHVKNDIIDSSTPDFCFKFNSWVTSTSTNIQIITDEELAQMETDHNIECWNINVVFMFYQ